MRKIILLIFIICVILLCGCWDKHELEDQTFVILLGLDKSETEDIIITIAYPQTQIGHGSGSEGKDSGKYAINSVSAPTLAEGLSMISVNLAGPVSLFSAKTIVISQELAEDDLFRHILSSWRYEQARNNTNVLISRCKASEFIGARIDSPSIDPLRQEDLLIEQANSSAYYSAVQFLDLAIAIDSDCADAVAMYGSIALPASPDVSESSDVTPAASLAAAMDDTSETLTVREGYLPGDVPIASENSSQICGLAVFKGGRLAGVLDSAEAETYAMLTGGKTRSTMTLPDPLDPKYKITVLLYPVGRSRVACDIADDTPVFDISVRLSCTVQSVQSDYDYTSGQNFILLADSINDLCVKRMEDLINKLQKTYGSDALKLGNKLAAKFLTVHEFEAYNWLERYKAAVINVSADIGMEIFPNNYGRKDS